MEKEIHLEESEVKIIRFCKNHYKDEYPWKGSWTESFKPLFESIYGWSPEHSYDSYLNALFNNLLDIFMKIKYDQSGNELQLKGVFSAAFYKGIVRNQESPIERAISELCGLIQSNLVWSEETGQRYTI